jgi:hypothetical protein
VTWNTNQAASRLAAASLMLLGLFLGLVAVAVFPLYATFMIAWMHAPATSVVVSTAPISTVLAIASFFVFRAGRRVLRKTRLLIDL